MAEGNENRATRLDRIERALELLVSDHEQFRHDHQQLLTAQVLQKDSIDGLLQISREHSRQLGEQHKPRLDQLDKLVSTIGELIAKQNRWGKQENPDQR